MAKKKLVIPPAASVSGGASSRTKSTNSRSGLPPGYEEGIKRPYFSTELDQEEVSKAKLTQHDKLISIALFVLSVALRFPQLSEPNSVVFDEVHAVKHINKYIDGVYFNDVTPPLSQLLYTLVAYLSGYRGEAHEISKAGESYHGTNFPYVTLRFITVLISSLNLPILFITLRNSGVRTFIAAAGSSLLLLENLVALHARLFMPDTLFLFGVSLVVYAYKKFDLSQPFSAEWFRLLLATGIGLGLTISTKWIGAATLFWVLALTAIKVWYLLGDIKVSDCKVTKHVGFRVAGFIIIPFVVYLATFFVHILLLKNFHNDASLLSSDFQRTLDYNDISNIPKYPTYGSTVTIRHTASIGGYLHSHPYPYKSGSKNQQVSVFDFKDFNNEWTIEAAKRFNESDPRIKPGGEFRLRHKLTGKLLSINDFKPPISEQEYDFEVSCTGNSTSNGEQNEQFWFRFTPQDGEEYLTAFDTKFQVQSVKKKCWLLSHDLKLPEWGFNQQEIICINSPTFARSLFYIETVKYPKDFVIPEGSVFEEKIPQRTPWFISKFFELNSKMFRLFKNIKPNNKNASSATSWPFLTKGLKYSTRPQSTLYVIGNPINFWLTLVLIVSVLIIKSVDLFKTDYIKESIQFKTHALSFVLGWFVHWAPYVFNEGEWFLQYYIPSLYFGILLIGVTFEFIYFRNKNLGRVIIGATVILAYYFYSSTTPLIFASGWTEEACLSAKWLPSWDFRCDAYRQVTENK